MTRARIELSAEADAILRRAAAEGLCIRDACRRAGVPENHARLHAKRYGLTFANGRFASPAITEKLQQAAAEGLTAPETASRYDLTADRVRYLGKRLGLTFTAGNERPTALRGARVPVVRRSRRRGSASAMPPPTAEERHWTSVKASLRW